MLDKQDIALLRIRLFHILHNEYRLGKLNHINKIKIQINCSNRDLKFSWYAMIQIRI